MIMHTMNGGSDGLRWHRGVLAVAVLAWLTALGSGQLFAQEGAAGERRPNIVLIMADDMGFSDLGCYGGEIDTPHLDRLAAAGLRFTQFYNNALCGPTRASLLTGLYPQQINIRGDFWTGRRNYDRCLTLGEALRLGGYHTMMVGKWQDPRPASERGFDRSLSLKAVVPISYFNEITHDTFFLDGEPVHPPAKGYFMTDWVTDYAVQFLEGAFERDRPYFLYATFAAPHWPLHAKEEHIARFRQRYLDEGWDALRRQRLERLRRLGLAEDNWRLAPRPEDVRDWEEDSHRVWQAERMAVYAAQIFNLDRNIGRILDAIDRSGTRSQTLVVFLSDNGAARDGGLEPTREPFSAIVHRPNWRVDGGAMRPGSSREVMPGPGDTFAAYGHAWANASNTPFRNFKWTAYEGGINTPVIVRWPEGIPTPGTITRQVGHVMDFMPTFLDVAGIEYPDEFDGRHPLPLEGRSLLPVFRGQIRAEPESLFWYVRSRAVRTGPWKLVAEGKQTPWELYDLRRDPTETTDVSAMYPERVQSMAASYDQWVKRVDLKVPGLFDGHDE